MNQPNNEGRPSAEAGEGRAQTKEDTVQSHMHPTQSGKSMSQRLHGVRQAAFASHFPILRSVSCARSLEKKILKVVGECDVPSERRCWSAATPDRVRKSFPA